MACEGVCTVEQNEIDDAERPKGTNYNGAPFEKPGDAAATVPEATSDAEIWDGQDFGDYTELVLTIGYDYSSQWQAGVERVFPRRRQLDCKDPGCSCKLGDNPTVVEDWSDWQRHEIHVPHVDRSAPSGTPPEIKARRLLLKGAVRHRKRILQGICRHNRNITIIAPFKTVQQEGD